MIRALIDHLYAIRVTIGYIVKGKFLLFFLPGVVISLAFLYYFQLVKSVEGYQNALSLLPWVGDYLYKGASFVIDWVEGLSIFIYQFILITVLSPFHTILSERVDEVQTLQKFSGNWEKIINDLVRTLGIIVLGGMLYLVVKLAWLMITYFIGGHQFTPYINLILIAFFTGFNSYDFSLERYHMSVAKSWIFAFKHPWHMLFSGLLFTVFLIIPYIGIVLAPVILTIVGTVSYLRINASETIAKKEK
jgi:CysZ protein